MRILLIEDDNDIRESLMDLLELEGYAVACAANGQEGLVRLRGHAARPHLILLDLMMPIMDGSEFRSEQLLDPQLADIPVIVISADHHARQRLENLQISAILRKPIDISILLKQIELTCD